jgi:hypothetical protein
MKTLHVVLIAVTLIVIAYMQGYTISSMAVVNKPAQSQSTDTSAPSNGGGTNPPSTPTKEGFSAMRGNRSHFMTVQGVDPGTIEDGFLRDTYAQNNGTSVNTDEYMLSQVTTPKDHAKHRKFVARDKPKSGQMNTLSYTIFEPTPEPRYNSYNTPRLKELDTLGLGVSSVDRSETEPRWNTGSLI